MDKDKILQSFNELGKAKKKSVTLSRLVILFSLVTIISVLIWAFAISQSAYNKILVVERSGEYLKITSENNEKLFQSLIKTTCAHFVNYANSFDRLTIKENQAKASFLCNKADLDAVISLYKQQKSYHSALERGVIYKCELEEVSFIGAEKPYKVSFTSILTILDGSNRAQFRVSSEGNLVNTTPRFPENVTGFFFTNYSQAIRPLDNE